MGEIRAVWWPVKQNHVVLGQEVMANSSYMWAWHYLVGMSDCVTAQKEPRTDGVFGLCTEFCV